MKNSDTNIHVSSDPLIRIHVMFDKQYCIALYVYLLLSDHYKIIRFTQAVKPDSKFLKEKPTNPPEPKKGAGKNRQPAKGKNRSDNPYAVLAEKPKEKDEPVRPVIVERQTRSTTNSKKTATVSTDIPKRNTTDTTPINVSWCDEEDDEVELVPVSQPSRDNLRRGRKFTDDEEELPPLKRKQALKPSDHFYDAVDDPSSLDSTGESDENPPTLEDESDNSAQECEPDSNPGDRSGSSESSNDSYADAANRGRWIVPNEKKQKQKYNKKPMFTLKAAEDVEVKDIYVMKLDYSNCNQPSDLENMVDRFCRERGVKPLELCTIPYGNSRRKANCKVSVAVNDYEKARRGNFWPKGSIVRDWLTKEEYQKKENARKEDSN